MKRWLLLLLPAGMGVAVYFFALMQTDLVLLGMLLAPLFLGFVIQSVALRLSRKGSKFLRLVPLGLALIPLAAAVNAATVQSGFLWIVDVILWGLITLLYIMGWGAARGLEGKDHG